MSKKHEPDNPAHIPVGYIQPGTPAVERWLRLFGRLSVPLEQGEPFEADTPQGPKMFYLLAFWRLLPSVAEIDVLIERLAAEWKVDLGVVRTDLLEDDQLPLLAEGIEVKMEPAADWPDCLRGEPNG